MLSATLRGCLHVTIDFYCSFTTTSHRRPTLSLYVWIVHMIILTLGWRNILWNNASLEGGVVLSVKTWSGRSLCRQLVVDENDRWSSFNIQLVHVSLWFYTTIQPYELSNFNLCFLARPLIFKLTSALSFIYFFHLFVFHISLILQDQFPPRYEKADLLYLLRYPLTC